MYDSIPFPEQIQFKTCRKCGETFPALSEFFPERKDSKDGLRSECKDCLRLYNKAYHQENLGKHRDQSKAWYKKNIEYATSYKKARYQANIEEEHAKRRAWRRSNPEKIRIQNKAWQDANSEYKKANAERIRKNQKAWRDANRDKRNEQARVRNKENPAKRAANKHNRRARMAGNGGAHTAAELKAIQAGQTDKKGNLHCWWCENIIIGSPHLDHKIAVAKGGTNDAGNLCYSCAKCNESKHIKSPAEFKGRLL